MLKTTAAGLTAWSMGSALLSFFETPKSPSFRVGACDWSIGKHSDPAALKLARHLGLDGVQVSVVNPEDELHLGQAARREFYLQQADENGVAVSSLAIGRLNQVPYKSAAVAESWVAESIPIARAMGISVILLAFFGDGDLRDDPAGKQEVIRRLRKVAPQAEAQGIVLGIESWLSADEHLEILDAVGSPAIQVYYDVANSHKMGYDIYAEIRQLGKARICEFHMKENGALLGQGAIDFRRVREVIDEIGYEGWVIIEGAIPEGGTVENSYPANARFMRTLFPS
jgi:sugar phosphate isomerase/epimerase